MLQLKNIGLIFLVMYSPLSIAESRSATSGLEWPVAKEIRAYGIKLKMPYSEAKKLMLKNGWKLSLFEKHTPDYKDFPEITCGEGYDAICSAAYSNGKTEQILHVREIKNKLVIRGSE